VNAVQIGEEVCEGNCFETNPSAFITFPAPTYVKETPKATVIALPTAVA
jgi:hypothetical protein